MGYENDIDAAEKRLRQELKILEARSNRYLSEAIRSQGVGLTVVRDEQYHQVMKEIAIEGFSDSAFANVLLMSFAYVTIHAQKAERGYFDSVENPDGWSMWPPWECGMCYQMLWDQM